MKLLVDMNLSPRWVSFLAAASIDAQHWSVLGRANSSDAEIMEYARLNGSVVLTQDLDFGAILAATNGRKPSVIQIRSEDLDPDVVGARIVSAIRQMSSELDEGALLTVDAKRTRVRILPLRS